MNVVAVVADGDVPSRTLPNITPVPVLVTIVPPLLVELVPLLVATAEFRLLNGNSLEEMVPEFVTVAPCVLLLLIWTTALLCNIQGR